MNAHRKSVGLVVPELGNYEPDASTSAAARAIAAEAHERLRADKMKQIANALSQATAENVETSRQRWHIKWNRDGELELQTRHRNEPPELDAVARRIKALLGPGGNG